MLFAVLVQSLKKSFVLSEGSRCDVLFASLSKSLVAFWTVTASPTTVIPSASISRARRWAACQSRIPSDLRTRWPLIMVQSIQIGHWHFKFSRLSCGTSWCVSGIG